MLIDLFDFVRAFENKSEKKIKQFGEKEKDKKKPLRKKKSKKRKRRRKKR